MISYHMHSSISSLSTYNVYRSVLKVANGSVRGVKDAETWPCRNPFPCRKQGVPRTYALNSGWLRQASPPSFLLNLTYLRSYVIVYFMARPTWLQASKDTLLQSIRDLHAATCRAILPATVVLHLKVSEGLDRQSIKFSLHRDICESLVMITEISIFFVFFFPC